MIKRHRLVIFLLFTSCFLFFISCKKDSFITSKNASLLISDTLLSYDTVFTTVGSITQVVKISNVNNQQLLLSQVKLAGGSASAFKIYINGIPGPEADNITIAANDSMYVFVTITINPTTANLPFIIRDSILISYNGNTQFIKLQAYGQNAHFLKNKIISRDTTWTNDLPYVILGSLQVATGATLTIQPGCRVYSHADAPFLVSGTLIVNGTKQDSVIFTGDRLDSDYSVLPASWPGIYLFSGSINNVLTHALIKNANEGIIIDSPSTNGNPKLILHRCFIDNAFGAGIICYNTSLNIDNSLISNCGSNVEINYGGTYNFTNCTVASYSNAFITHKNPVLQITNVDATTGLVNPSLNASFLNCIFWSDMQNNVPDEITVNIQGTNTPNVQLSHCLYKVTDDPANTDTVAVIKNLDPGFDSINANSFKPIYNFHLDSISPAIKAGLPSPPSFIYDLDDNSRSTVLPQDLGCYERQ
jgi:hypothetical protein